LHLKGRVTFKAFIDWEKGNNLVIGKWAISLVRAEICNCSNGPKIVRSVVEK